ncbi:MAG: hypothetical protein KKD48_01560 [Nanoarchaeota archaeon]|nr:hypothetical protein [Nanoarchaeota archaeon]
MIIKFLIFFAIVLFLDWILFTYLHELAHKKALKRAGIKGTIAWNFREILKHIIVKPIAICWFEEDKLRKLSYKKKKDIFLSGIKTDLIILVVLSVLSIFSWFLLVLNNKFIFGHYSLIICNVLILIKSWDVLNNLFKKNSDLDKFYLWKDK